MTADDLYEDLQELERQLRETRRRANDRDAQCAAIRDVSRLAELKLPMGLGDRRDHARIGPQAAAILFLKALRRAQKNVPTLPQDLDALEAGIGRLLKRVPPMQVHWSG